MGVAPSGALPLERDYININTKTKEETKGKESVVVRISLVIREREDLHIISSNHVDEGIANSYHRRLHRRSSNKDLENLDTIGEHEDPRFLWIMVM